MGKNQRSRKEQRVSQELQEKQAIELRRQERTQPLVQTTKRVTLAVLATIALLYVGVFVVARLGQILSKITPSL